MASLYIYLIWLKLSDLVIVSLCISILKTLHFVVYFFNVIVSCKSLPFFRDLLNICGWEHSHLLPTSSTSPTTNRQNSKCFCLFFRSQLFSSKNAVVPFPLFYKSLQWHSYETPLPSLTTIDLNYHTTSRHHLSTSLLLNIKYNTSIHRIRSIMFSVQFAFSFFVSLLICLYSLCTEVAFFLVYEILDLKIWTVYDYFHFV